MSPPLIFLGADDAPRIASLHGAAADDAWPVQDYRKMLSDGAHLGLGIVDEADDTLSAFALCQTVLDTADLLMIATHPNARRQGYARTLVRALLSRLGARGIAKLTLDVAADNIGAIGLYAAMGFTVDGRRKAYYRREDTRIDAILMSRPVAGLPRPEKA